MGLDVAKFVFLSLNKTRVKKLEASLLFNPRKRNYIYNYMQGRDVLWNSAIFHIITERVLIQIHDEHRGW